MRIQVIMTQLLRAPIKFDNDKEITATSGPVVVMLLRRIGARGALDVTRVPYWGLRGARCNWLLNPLQDKL